MQRLLSFLLVLSFTFQLSAHRITIEVNTTDALLAALAKAPKARTDTLTILLHDGNYEIYNSLALNGCVGKRIQIKAINDGQAIISGGLQLPAEQWTPLKDRKIKAMLPSLARKSVKQISLKDLGISDYGTMKGRGFSKEVRPMQMELFANGARQQLARWPNYDIDAPYEGKARYSEVIEVGATPRTGDTSELPAKFIFENQRIANWTKNDDVWLHGVWAWDWADRSVRLLDVDTEHSEVTIECSNYGLKPNKYFYVVNAVAELDAPGEYYIDRKTGILYYWPIAAIEETVLSVSILEQPLLTIKNCENVSVEGLVFQEGRSVGISIVGGENNVIDNCVVRALGTAAINIGEGQDGDEIVNIGYGGVNTSKNANSGLYSHTGWNRHGGKRNGVRNSEIYDIAAYGVMLGGGDRKTLTRADNFVENCDIHHVARVYEQMFSNVHIDGVGNRVSNCDLSYNPHSAIMFWGNDHTIEYNEIHHCVYNSSDAGAIYTGRDPSQTGSTIRWNFFHHIYGHHDYEGVFFDDGASGMRVEGNIFYDIQSRGATKYHGGQCNAFVNNIVVDCIVPVGYQLWNQSKWNDFLASDLAKKRLFEAVNILEEPYLSAYPWLSRVFDVPYAKSSHIEERNLLTTIDDPLFENGSELDFRITDWAKLRDRVPGMQVLPVERIGLKRKSRRLLSPVFQMKTQRLFPGQEFSIVPAKILEGEDGFEIFYTTDGSEPDRNSIPFTKPLIMDRPTTINARLYQRGKPDELASNVKTQICEKPEGTIYLDELYPESIIAHNGIKMNHNYAFSNYVFLGGKRYMHSVMACPTKDQHKSELVYDLAFANGKITFKTDYGIDAVSQHGTTYFIVKGKKGEKETELFRSEKITEGGKLHTLQLDVSAYDKLILITTDGGDHIWGDHTAWGEARLVIE